MYALIRSFAANQVRFHAADGAGYAFVTDQILALDALNPQIAARIGISQMHVSRLIRRSLEKVRDEIGAGKQPG